MPAAASYSTYLGGAGEDEGFGIAVDKFDEIYVTGFTTSSNFPTRTNVQGSTAGGGRDAFVAKFDDNRFLAYSTYLGGSGTDEGLGIAVDSSGNAYVTGVTASTNFPTTSPLQGSNAGNSDAFVTKLTASGALAYSTYLGGSGQDGGGGIAVDSSGNVYVTGFTSSSNFPTASALQGSYAGGPEDAFVMKLDIDGNLKYSTFLGGGGNDEGFGIAADSSGNAYVTGETSSTNFPTAGALQASNAGGFSDAFVTKLTASGALAYSTYLGGAGVDEGLGIAVDSSGIAYVTGETSSADFPTASPFQGSNAGGTSDAFMTKLTASGTLTYSTYLGGAGADEGLGIAVDTSDNAYVTGYTQSTNFPTAHPYLPALVTSTQDAFVTRFPASAAVSIDDGVLSLNYGAANLSITITNSPAGISLSGADFLAAGAGPFSGINQIVVTDTGNFTGDSLTVTGSTAYTLSGGASFTGQSIDIEAAIRASSGSVILSTTSLTLAAPISSTGTVSILPSQPNLPIDLGTDTPARSVSPAPNWTSSPPAP